MSDEGLVPQQWIAKLRTAGGSPDITARRILEWLVNLYAYGEGDSEDPDFEKGHLRLSYNHVADKFDINHYEVHRILENLDTHGILERDMRHFAKGVRRTFIKLTPEFLDSVDWDGDDDKRLISLQESP